MRAGKMYMKGHMVYPDTRKGLLYVYQGEDSLMHFCWKDRTTGIVEDDLIIFPDDCEYVRVPQCTTGRVYLLRFRSSDRKFFFWLQEPRTEKDEEHCKRINELLNGPSLFGTVQSTPISDADLQTLLNNLSNSQLMQLFTGADQMGYLSNLLDTFRGPSGSAGTTTTPAVTPRTTVPNTPTATASMNQTTPPMDLFTPQNAPIPTAVPDTPRSYDTSTFASDTTPSAADTNPMELSDWENFLQDFTLVGSDTAEQQELVDLSTVLTSDALLGILNNPETLQQLESHLPPVDGSAEENLKSTLASPEFQQAVSEFSSALESGQLAPVVSQLVMNADAIAAAAEGNIQEFFKALEKSTSFSDDGSSEQKDKDKDSKKEDIKDDDDEE